MAGRTLETPHGAPGRRVRYPRTEAALPAQVMFAPGTEAGLWAICLAAKVRGDGRATANGNDMIGTDRVTARGAVG